MDAYSILGISKSATQAEIDAAFRSLMEKYSEEKYSGNPLSDLASKKRRELESAYDTIIKERAKAQSENSNEAKFQSNTTYSSDGSDPRYSDIRQKIEYGDLNNASRILQSISVRDAQWYYLSGCIALRRGLYNEAYMNFRTATDKDPSNAEYRNAYMRMEQQSGNYRNVGADMQQAQCCNCCSNLLIADCCCECLGGDLISCC